MIICMDTVELSRFYRHFLLFACSGASYQTAVIVCDVASFSSRIYRVFYKVKSRSAHMKSHAEQEKKAAALRQKEEEEQAAAAARARKAAVAAAAAVAHQGGNGVTDQAEVSSQEDSSEGEDDDDEDWH